MFLKPKPFHIYVPIRFLFSNRSDYLHEKSTKVNKLDGQPQPHTHTQQQQQQQQLKQRKEKRERERGTFQQGESVLHHPIPKSYDK